LLTREELVNEQSNEQVYAQAEGELANEKQVLYCPIIGGDPDKGKLVDIGTARADGLDCNGRQRGKACSVAVPIFWRATMPVADMWTRSTCEAFAVAKGASEPNFVCTTTNGFSYGAGASVPNIPPPPTNNTCGR
jgi:hypothetical protein